jgi:putative PIN family toxin of toxin-antitoxin system
MRVVVDTNILIRALIKPSGTVGPILRRLAQAEFEMVYSRAMFEELLEKLALPRLKNKYHITDDVIADLVALLTLRAKLVAPDVTVTVCRDPEDNMVIEAALAGRAECIVTGDDDLLTLHQYEGIDFIAPREFIAKLDAEKAS